MDTVKEQIIKLKNDIEKKLDEYVKIKYPQNIYESMKYSLMAGGKRLRPIMTIEAAKMINPQINIEDIMPVACAVEMLHTQSLIHDDLPCMDNDDYRRGKLTNHKKFNEYTAVLAGDALLSYAPKIIIEKMKGKISEKAITDIIYEFTKAAGVDGIISGQIVDLDSEGKDIDFETLNYIHEYKTAKLFVFAIKSGAIAAGATEKQLEVLEEFAMEFGRAFQICDDVLDEISSFEELGKTPHKDENSQKATYISFFGIEKSKEEAIKHSEHAYAILKENGLSSDILKEFSKDITRRMTK